MFIMRRDEFCDILNAIVLIKDLSRHQSQNRPLVSVMANSLMPQPLISPSLTTES